MLHTTRRWCVVPVTRDQLVDRLAGHAWDLCAGFACEGVLWLNDSISRDSPQMFAAVRQDALSGEWQQLDVFSVSWMARERLKSLLEDLSMFAGWPVAEPAIDRVDSGALCQKCA